MPKVDDEDEILIKDGRHPVIERMIDNGSFVENDTYLNRRDDRLSIITGPNMAGKSTYMRQGSTNYINGTNRKLCTSIIS